MKIQFEIYYNGKSWFSDMVEVKDKDSDEYIEAVEFIEDVSKGKYEYFSMKNSKIEYYFPKNVLENSVISIIES